MASYQTRQLIQNQQTQQRPCDDSRYKMGGASRVLERTELAAAVVGAAAAAYLLLIATNPYVIGARACAMLAGGMRSLAVLSSAGQYHSTAVCKTDAAYVPEARAVVAARQELERVSNGRVLEALLVYLMDDECCDEETRKYILGGFRLLARCAFAFLNRLERQQRETISRADFDQFLALMRREIRDSRREIMPKAFPKGGPKKPVLVVAMATAAPAPKGHPGHGKAMLPVLLAWIAMATQEEICRTDGRRFYESPFQQSLLACIAVHFCFALPVDKDELGVARARYGRAPGLTPAEGKYWGFEDGDGSFEVLYSMPMTLIANIPDGIATQLLSDAHTKGPHHLLDLNSFATVKLIGDAYNEGSPCGAVEVAHFLPKRDSYQVIA